jgi:hypothetical protein
VEAVGWVEAAIVATRVGFVDCSKVYKERSMCFRNLYLILGDKPQGMNVRVLRCARLI